MLEGGPRRLSPVEWHHLQLIHCNSAFQSKAWQIKPWLQHSGGLTASAHRSQVMTLPVQCTGPSAKIPETQDEATPESDATLQQNQCRENNVAMTDVAQWPRKLLAGSFKP